MTTGSNDHTTNTNSVQILGIAIVPDRPPKGILSVKVLVDGKEFCKHRFKEYRNGDAQIRWDLSPPLMLQPGCRLELHLRIKRTFTAWSTLLTEASISSSEAQNLLLGVPVGERKEYQLKNFAITFASGLDVHSTILTTAIDKSRGFKNVLDRLAKARTSLETLLKFGTAASELHPIAKAILASVNVVYQILKEQEAINKDILDLVENMSCAICYLEDVKQFARIVQLKEAIEDARPLVEDTTNLILQMAAQSGEVSALRTVISSSNRDKIDKLSKRFNRFRQQFDRGIAVQSSVTLELLQTLQVTEKEDRLLAALKPPHLDDLPPVTGCMPNTRKDILAEIHKWIENLDTTPNILWLTGFPGVGKSTITSTLVEDLQASHHLGSSFFFKRANATVTTPTALWRSVAFDLARLYPTVKQVVMEKLDRDIVRTRTAGVEALFLHLIKEPLESGMDIPSGRFPVVIIDALDECGGLDGPQSDLRKSLLKTLTSWSHLPPQFKLVVTSRDEDDLNRVLGPISHHLELASGDKASPQSSRDIHLFLQMQFKEIVEKWKSLPDGWPGQDVIEELTKQAAGLFNWAKTIVKLVDEGVPQKRLKRIQEGDLHNGDMMALYRLILDISFKNPSYDEVNSFITIVGAIIAAKTPLHQQDYTSLLSIESSEMEMICKGLHSVMEDSEVLRFHHQSFVDFLLDPKSCPCNFLINENNQTQMLMACLKSMQNELRFNICGLETSYVSNDEAPNCHVIAHNPIPTYLAYCCQYWVDHLVAVSFNTDIMKQVQIFMHEQFLYWLEVLSIIKKVNIAREALLSIAKWCHSHDNDTAAFAHDATKFVTAFGGVISHSVPHLYLSALPFAPIASKVSMQFLHQFPQTISIKTGKATDWPAIQCVINMHGNGVNSVAFSPDGRCIVSGSDDKSICIWDVASGDIIAGPFKGHTESITSVAFSPDGTRIVSGSGDKTILVWDAANGDIISGPFKGHTNWVKSVAFSPDGTQIVSNSDNKIIHVWNATTGDLLFKHLRWRNTRVRPIAVSPDGSRIISGSETYICVHDAANGTIIAGPLRGHTGNVKSIAFSPDGTRIVSGSGSNIYIWDTESGDIIGRPFTGHSQWVRSVAFSPDGTRIVSGSDDGTIRVWDAESKDIIPRPFQACSGGVVSPTLSPYGTQIFSSSNDRTICIWNTASGEIIPVSLGRDYRSVGSVVFSPNGKYIVSDSSHQNIYVWDAARGDITAGPFEGHKDFVRSAAFSPDGTCIVSGSDDKTVCVWNVAIGGIIAKPFKGHTGYVNSVAFSPDGRSIVSGSGDKTILVWDAASGNIIAGPFKKHTDWVRSVAFSPDGTHIVSASDDKCIFIWNVENRDIIAGPFKKHTDWVRTVAFSPDGIYLVSGSKDSNIFIWDVAHGDIIAGPFRGHTDTITSITFLPNGTSIISGSFDKTIRVWDIGDLITTHNSSPSNEHHNSQLDSSVTPRLQGIYNSYNPFNVLKDDSRLENGWLLGPNDELLFWIPPWTNISRPRNSIIISSQEVTHLDFSKFVYDTQWQNCCKNHPCI